MKVYLVSVRIFFKDGNRLIGKYKAEKGDHYKIIEIATKKFYYHRTYKVYYNGKIISNNDKIRIYNIY